MSSCLTLQRRIPQRNSRHLLVIFLLPLVFSFIPTPDPFHFLAQGRQMPPDPNSGKLDDQERGVAVKMMKVVLMGSRPPRCDQTRCKDCGKCEAIQVPISPTDQQQRDYYYSITAYARGDGISSYKPMCWKCKCGDFIVNP